MNRRTFLTHASALAVVPLIPAFQLPLRAPRRVDGTRLNGWIASFDTIGRTSAGINRVAYSDADLAGRAFVLELWEFAAFIANSLVFLLIGLTAARVPFQQVGWGPLGAAIVLVLIGRAATVYPLSSLFARSSWRIGIREQHVLWWAGLRGALALALVLALPPNLPLRDAIVIATFAVVTFSVMIQGLTMKPLLRGLGLLPPG